MMDATPSYLVFTLSGTRYAFNLSQIAEVIEQTDTWPIPLAPDYYRGAMNFHGSIVAVMDLARFLKLPGAGAAEKVIVLDPALAALAFVVESICKITTGSLPETAGAQQDDRFVTGRLVLPEGPVLLLDAAAVAEHAAETING